VNRNWFKLSKKLAAEQAQALPNEFSLSRTIIRCTLGDPSFSFST
jgi:hypothetical protein